MDLIVELPVLVLGVLGSCEIVLRSPISRHISRLKCSVEKAMRCLSSARVSDHWKALAARRYAVDVLVSTLVIVGGFVVALLPVVASLSLALGSLDAMLVFASRPDVTVVLTIVAVGYLLLRARVSPRG
jgi:hypothetical protein